MALQLIPDRKQVDIAHAYMIAKYEEEEYQKSKVLLNNFVYKFKLGHGLLEVSRIPFGDEELEKYGLLMYDVPRFKRIKM